MDKLMGAITDFLVLYGGWGIVAIMIILVLFFGDRLFTSVERFWAVFRHLSSFTFKRYTSTRLSNQILHATKSIGSIDNDILPYRVKIKWVKSEKTDSFLKSGQIIVKISDDDDINKSFVLAITEYVRQGLIRSVKRHLRDEPLVQAIDLCTVGKVLSQAYIESLSYFEKSFLNDLLKNDEHFLKHFELLRKIDYNGLYLPVFLNELSKSLRRYDGRYFIEDFEKEAKAFLGYLVGFCSDKHKKLNYNGKYIHISFGLIANSSFIFKHGRDAYVEKVRASLSRGAQTVYLFGWEDKIKTVKQIAERTARTDLRIKKVRIHYYRHVFEDHSTARAICAELSTIENENLREPDLL
ncbi:MAG: hypothetical protein PHR24_04035 [Oscillospiraceae bacterium]|nr:hypothetical protein [Oscillospiraceae bacterium]MDD3832653.1 hypothetical protein [Oscillospiraceae bacterium]MDD4546443.1 hypothetical protein [Oscillospiraceae bacterium]